MRALIVDDMGAMRQTVKKTMIGLGFNDLLDAKNGKDALEILLTNHDIPGKKINLAIVDWNMSPVSGLDLLKTIRADKRISDLIFIMLTAEQARDNIVLAVHSGVDDYIVKPFTQNILKEKLTNLTAVKLTKINREIEIYINSPEGENFPQDSYEVYEKFRKKVDVIGELAPWSHYAPLFIGKMSLLFRNYRYAEEFLRKTVAIDFGISEAHELLAKVLRILGKSKESLAELEVAAVERPTDPALKQKLGEAYLYEGNLDMAVAALQETVKLLESEESNNRSLASGKEALGMAQLKIGAKRNDRVATDSGVINLKEAALIDPTLVSAHYNLMVAYQKNGMNEKAAEIYANIVNIEPKDSNGWISLGKTYLLHEEVGKALFAFRKGDQLSYGDPQVYITIAEALYHSGFYRESLPYIDKAEEANPSDIFPFNMRGLIYRRLGEYEQAVTEYEKAVAVAPDDAGLHFNLGIAYLKSGLKEKSRELFLKALKLDPNLKEAKDYLAENF